MKMKELDVADDSAQRRRENASPAPEKEDMGCASKIEKIDLRFLLRGRVYNRLVFAFFILVYLTFKNIFFKSVMFSLF